MSLRVEIGKIVLGLAEYYDKQLTDNQVEMYIDDLIDIPPESLLYAIKMYRQNSENDRYPLPSKLRSLIQLPDDQRARDAVSLILEALRKYSDPYGHPSNRERHDKAKAHIGELGWLIVQRYGGWVALSSTDEDSIGVVAQAQWRELAISLINKNKLGLMEEKPALEFKSKNKTGQLESLGGMFTLPMKKKADD